MWTCGAVRDEEHGGLAGGIAAADDHDLLVLAQPRLHRRRGVVDALALEAIVVGQVEAPVARAGRDDDGCAPLAVAPSASFSAERRSIAFEAASTLREIASRAPNFCACTWARPASAWPEMPVGKPR